MPWGPARGSAVTLGAVAVLIGGATLLWTAPALACGGTFCDGGPLAMPVDQTGENILFVVEDGMVEAHIQIQYEGDAERFAWVLPLPAIPEALRVGSEPLFRNLLNGSVPSYGYATLCGGRTIAAVNGGGGIEVDPSAQRPTPLVVVTKVVGAFEVSILQGGTAQEVINWLDDNGYEQIPEAEPIFEEYVRQNHVFAALKLTSGAGINEIHPIVVRYRGTDPCVPLKLTRVAATENMGVRAFFLGEERYAPTNYKHVTLNPAAIDWSTFASNYVDVVSRAVDSPFADGQAFITEFAGSSTVVPRTGIYGSNWNAEAYVNTDPVGLVTTLEQQGFMSCSAASCVFNHPLIEPLLTKYLPPPEGVDPYAFYDCVACYANQIDLSQFDSVGFAADFSSRIVVPGRDANELLNRHPFLTRLFTTISPDEMTVDPLFHPHGVEPVSNFNQVNRALGDGASSAYQVTNDWIVELSADGSWPDFDGDMPAALRVDEYQPDGDVVDLVDFSDEIEAALEASNKKQDYVGLCQAFGTPPGAAGAAGDTGTQTTGLNPNGTTSSTATSGSGGSGPNDPATSASDASGGGCSCRVASPSPTPHASLALGLVGLWWSRRRRARRA